MYVYMHTVFHVHASDYSVGLVFKFEKAKVINHRLRIRLGVNSIFPVQFQSSTRCVRLTNQVDILNVQVEWS